MVPVPPLIALLAPLVGGAGVLVWRLQETRSPVTPAKILMPPLGMSTGLFMFVSPAMRVPWMWAVAAFLLGALVLVVPLARTSRLERKGDIVWMRRSNGFLLILLGLLALRLLLHEWIGDFLPPRPTAALFFLLAYGMILRWRAGMYLQYRRLVAADETRAS